MRLATLALRQPTASCACPAAGSELSVSWFKDGKPLRPDDDDKVKMGVDGDEYFVELTDCAAETGGEYTCTASNVAGDACCTVNVIVTGRTPARPCLLYTSPSPRDRQKSRMPSSA